MVQPENKGILAPTKHSVLYKASQSIVCFAGVNKAQCRKMNISTQVSSFGACSREPCFKKSECGVDFALQLNVR